MSTSVTGPGIVDLAVIAKAFARQARTIRRLRALADGYRARVCHGCYRKQLLTAVVAAKQERARIVAALRAKVCANTSTNWDREATALSIVADAIERGEL